MTTTAALLVNTGTPAAPTPEAIRPYLARFLSDRRIVNVPAALWKPLLHGIILNTRPRHTATRYEHIWTPQGSPYTLASEALERGVAKQLGPQWQVALAQRYGEPSLRHCVERFAAAGIRRLVVLPLYPQQAYSTTESVRDELGRALAGAGAQFGAQLEVDFIESYYDNEHYLDAVAGAIESQLAKLAAQQPAQQQTQVEGQPPQVPLQTETQQQPAQQQAQPQAPQRAAQQPEQASSPQLRPHLLFSFHSVPLKNLRKGDPYCRQVEATAAALAKRLDLAHDNWSLVYQSRFEDMRRWQGPFLHRRLVELLAGGTRSFAISCPGFAVDCLETLYEIELEARKHLLAAAASLGVPSSELSFAYLPALGASEEHAALLAGLLLSG